MQMENTLHTNALKILLECFDLAEYFEASFASAYGRFLVELANTNSQTLKPILIALSQREISDDQIQAQLNQLADHVEKGLEITIDTKIKVMVVSRLRNLRAGV